MNDIYIDSVTVEGKKEGRKESREGGREIKEKARKEKTSSVFYILSFSTEYSLGLVQNNHKVEG